MSTYDEAMATGAHRYADVLEALQSKGLVAEFTQTGGMCAAIEIRLERGASALITDAEDSLSWNREDHRGWGVGLYREGSEYDDGPVDFQSTEDSSPAALLGLVASVLLNVQRAG